MTTRYQRDIDHWNETGKCLRHFSIDVPPLFCEQCGKPWKAVLDGREGRTRRRQRRAIEAGTHEPAVDDFGNQYLARAS